MMKRTLAPLAALAALALLLPARAGAELVVDMINREASAVLVSVGTDDGVSEEDDFVVVDAKGGEIARIYPFELYNRRFWSQPLAKPIFDQIASGLTVKKIELERDAHWELRYRGAAWRRQKARERLAAVIAGLENVWQRSRDLSEAIGTLSSDLRNQVEKARGSEKLDEARKDLLSLYAERDDLAERRSDLATQSPYPTRKIERLDRDVAKNRDRISDTLIFIRDEEQSGVLPVFWASRILSAASSIENMRNRVDDLAQTAYRTLGAAELIDGLIEPPLRKKYPHGAPESK